MENYIFKQNIPVLGDRSLNDEEYEDIAVNANDPDVIQCLNCYAVLQSDTNRNYLVWGLPFFEISRKIKDHNGKSYVEISIQDSDEIRVVNEPLSSFNSSKLDSLSKHGLFCESKDIIREKLSKYFIKKISAMPFENKDSANGFSWNANGDFTFMGYDGNEPHGLGYKNSFASEKEYITALNEVIEPSVPMQFMISISIGALLLAYLSMLYNVPVKSFVVNIVNKSTTGKTGSQELAASMISSIKDSTVFAPLYGTEAAIVHSLQGNGIIKNFDEGTAAGNLNWKAEGLIYTISNDRGKARLQSDGKPRKSTDFKTIVTISSEEAFFESSSNRHQGLAVRLHQYRDLQFTINREHSEAVHKLAAENSGIIGCKVVEQLMSEDDGDLLERYNNHRDYMRKLIGSHACSLTERLIGQYSLILLAADILKEFGVAVDIEAIAKLMLDNHNQVALTTDIAKNAYEVLMDYVSRNAYSTGIRLMEGKNEVAIVESLFNEILNKNGFMDVKTVVNELDKHGYSKRREENRKKVKLSMNGNSCYCYLLDTTKLEGKEEESPIKRLLSDVDEPGCF